MKFIKFPNSTTIPIIGRTTTTREPSPITPQVKLLSTWALQAHTTLWEPLAPVEISVSFKAFKCYACTKWMWHLSAASAKVFTRSVSSPDLRLRAPSPLTKIPIRQVVHLTKSATASSSAKEAACLHWSGWTRHWHAAQKFMAKLSATALIPTPRAPYFLAAKDKQNAFNSPSTRRICKHATSISLTHTPPQPF